MNWQVGWLIAMLTLLMFPPNYAPPLNLGLHSL
jgi:hypothetical protein